MQGFETFMAVVASVILYWLPTLLASFRHAPSVGTVAVVNGFLGWTGIGWVIALAMAFRSPEQGTHRRPVVVQTQPTGRHRDAA